MALEAVGLACQILRCKRPEGEVLEGYVALLAEYPRDLLMPSIKAAIEQEKYHVLPTPGALLEKAGAALRERREKYDTLKIAMWRLSVADMMQRRARRH